MKIAFDHQTFFRQQYGGISRYFTELITRLADYEGISPHVFAPYNMNAYINDLPEALRTGKVLKGYDGIQWQLYRYLNHFKGKSQIASWRPNVVHETYYENWSVAPRKTPVVVTVYDMIQEVFPEYLRKGDRTSIRKKIAVDRADHVIAISEKTKSDLMELFDVPERKITVSYLAADPIPEDLQVPGDLVTEKKFILYVGKRKGYKGFKLLLAALAQRKELNDLDVVAFGGGPYSASQLTEIESYGLHTSRFHQLGGPDALLARYYSAAEVFIVPSEYEGFGIPPLEAMTYGCPVVSSTGGSLPEVVGDAALCFAPNDVELLGEQLTRAVEDRALRADLQARGFAQAAKFSWDRCAQEHLNVYRSLL